MFFCGSVLVFFRQTNTRREIEKNIFSKIFRKFQNFSKKLIFFQKNFYVFLRIRVRFFQTNEHASKKYFLRFFTNFQKNSKNLIFSQKKF